MHILMLTSPNNGLTLSLIAYPIQSTIECHIHIAYSTCAPKHSYAPDRATWQYLRKIIPTHTNMCYVGLRAYALQYSPLSRIFSYLFVVLLILKLL